MRRALLATSAIVAFALATYACGGDDDTNSDVPAPGKDAGKTSSSGNSSSGNSSSGSSGSTSSGSTSSGSTSSGSTSGSTSGNTSNGGVPPVDDAGSVKDGSAITDSGTPDANESDGSAGLLCQVGSIQESEPNGGDGNADEITGDHAKFCGTVSTSDNDTITFTLPVDASGFSIAVNTSAALQLEGTVNGGQPFVLTGADAGSAIPFVAGGKYLLKATTTVAKSDYIIALDITRSPASTKCEADSAKESEDNSTDGTADPMPTTSVKSSFCGTINTATDVDKFTFTLASTVTKFKYDFATTGSNFKLSCTVDGVTTDLTAAGASLPFKTEKPYLCTASSTTSNNGYIFHLDTTP